MIIIFEKALAGIRVKIGARLRITENSFSDRLVFAGITFLIVCFAWVFFRANTMGEAILLIQNTFVDNFNEINYGGLYKLGLNSTEFWTAMVAILLLLLFDFFHKRRSALRWLSDQNVLFRYAVYVIIVFVILIFGVYGDMAPQDFIYFQF